ncbi:SufD family Fe-S cluster assembly protein [Thermofilum sp.]|uniref:SufB/SufD family protein n=1 Tax=Thermofilum sp. TaxID=1961369 RepID=UPI0031601C59
MKQSYLTLPYQYIADSPTTKSYAKWQIFEEYLQNPRRAARLRVNEKLLFVKPHLKIPTNMAPHKQEADWPLNIDTRLQAFHFQSLSTSTSIEIRGEEKVLLIEKPLSDTYSAHLNIYLEGKASATLLLLSPEDSEGLSTLSLNIKTVKDTEAKISIIVIDSPKSATALFKATRLEPNSTLKETHILVSGRTLHLESETFLDQENATYISSYAVATPQNRSASIQTSAYIKAPRAIADIRLAGISHNGELAHKGTIRIHKGSQEARGKLSSRLIPLTPNSKVYAAPTLEIESDDAAEAQHSASQSPLDPAKLFYLQSRALTELEAKRLLLMAELNKVLPEDAKREPTVQKYLELLLGSLEINIHK